MIKRYFKTILILIILNAILITTAGFLSQWDISIIISGILQFPLLIIILFLSYLFLNYDGIKNSKILKSVFILVPGLIMLILFVVNIVKLNSGNYIEFGYGLGTGGFLRLWHLKIGQTIMVIGANLITFKKEN